MAKYLTVIIPTYNRVETLQKCLNALAAQTCPADGVEVIIADDGSTDETAELVKRFAGAGTLDVKYFWQTNKGPAAARNLGIRNASGEVLLFLGDDIIAGPCLLKRHILWHKKNRTDNTALLGYVTWAENLAVTPFMRWLENGGTQFRFNELEDSKKVDPAEFLYTCNVSLKRVFLTANGLFDEDFPYAALEDVELGRRLKVAGLELYFDRKAIAWHDHYTSLKDACRRMVKVGESKCILDRKTGSPAHIPASFIRRALKVFKVYAYYMLASFLEKRMVSDAIFKYVMVSYYIRGIERAGGGGK